MAFMMKLSLACFSALAFLQSRGMAVASTNEEKETRNLIIGGENAQPGEFPFFAAGVGCGGSLIHEDIVLTAAHCIYDLTFKDFAQIGGIISPFRNNPTELDGEIIPTVCFLNHPDYVHMDTGIGSSDIALVKLARPSTNSQPIVLNFDVNVPLVNESVTAVGNGVSGYSLPVLPGLKYTPMNPESLQVFKRFLIQSEDVCKNGSPTAYTPDSHLCTSDNDPVTATCGGDSGGPLLTQDGVQIGVLSYGFNEPITGACIGSTPNYWTNVAKFQSFIEEGICALSNNPPAYCPNSTDVSLPSTCSDLRTSAPSVVPLVAPVKSPTNAPKASMKSKKGMMIGGHGKGMGMMNKGGMRVKGKGKISKNLRIVLNQHGQ